MIGQMNDYYKKIKTYFYKYNNKKLYNFSPLYAANTSFYIQKFLNFTKNYTILELGCGDGIVSHELAKNNPNCNFICIDFSKENIAYANNHYKLNNIKFIYYDILEIENFYKIYEHKFDIIFSFGLAQYVYHTDFIDLNIKLHKFITNNGKIAHFNIPDTRKKIATILDNNYIYSNKISFFIHFLFDIFTQNEFCKYENDNISLWHSPDKISRALKQLFISTIVTPSVLWYRFDIILTKR